MLPNLYIQGRYF